MILCPVGPSQAPAPTIQPDRTLRIGPPVEHLLREEAIDTDKSQSDSSRSTSYGRSIRIRSGNASIRGRPAIDGYLSRWIRHSWCSRS